MQVRGFETASKAKTGMRAALALMAAVAGAAFMPSLALAADPIEQFQIHPIFPAIAFTNSAAYLVAAAAIVILFMLLATRRQKLVPDRWQAAAEMSYEFVADTVRQSAGTEGMRFMPFVFSIFMFVLIANLLGLIPYSFSTTSHIIITFALSMLVILTVIVYGFMRHGFGFLKLFVPHGVPMVLMPLVVAIEIVSFMSRPISLSVRLFANMLAGHITLKVFGAFVVGLSSLGVLGSFGAVMPFLMVVALTALEVLVAVLQAYVFAILTCIYLNDAIHPSH
jgi:F-type H+-transporting ATPase subunit a